MHNKIIYHIDVNSAFLSWEALRLLEQGYDTDIRTIPSIIGGDREKRHGIVLAKSTPAKKYGIVTAEPIGQALKKCPNLAVFPSHYDYYQKCSKAFMDILRRYAPIVEQYSVDEAFCDMTGTASLYGNLTDFAIKIKDTIYNELGFTVNVGVSTNKLLAKMASDFEKPNKVHTLFPEEIPAKLWPLPVKELFFVGKSSYGKMQNLGIRTIGDLAKMDPDILRLHFKKQGETFYNFANGIATDVLEIHDPVNKGYSNAITLPKDITDSEAAHQIILSLCEVTCSRIRADKAYVNVVGVQIVDCEFNKTSKQLTLDRSTNVTGEIYDLAIKLFDQLWTKEPIRLLSVTTSKASDENYEQIDLFDNGKHEKLKGLDSAIDKIRDKYGDKSIMRASLVNADVRAKNKYKSEE